MAEEGTRFITPFNGPVEIGLRALAVLSDAYSDAYSMQRLVVFDYLIVHSDDVLSTKYVVSLRERAAWLVRSFGKIPDADLEEMVRGHVGEWGAEFTMESVLWAEETQ